MGKPAGRLIGRWAGVSVSIALAGAGMVALRHALETPQPLKSVLPGEAHLYRWRRRSIFYKVLGAVDAPPLVLLHRPEIGVSGHEMLAIMAPLAQTYRVYAPDLLGFGLSDRPGAEYSAELYSALCQDFLREVVGCPAMLVASELSCNYAVATADYAPELCTSLVLISPLALQEEAQSTTLRQYAEKPVVKMLLYPLLSTRLAFLLMRQFRQESKEDFAQFYANTHQLGAEHAAMARLSGKLAENMQQQFARLQQPVLMIWGTRALDNQQTVATLHRTAELANPAHVARKVELIQGTALTAHMEQPEDVVAAIRRWQEETGKNTVSGPAEKPNLAFQAAEQQSISPAALVEPASTAAPRAEQTSSAQHATASTQADSAEAVDRDTTPARSGRDEAQGTLEAAPLRPPVELAAEDSEPIVQNKAEETVETVKAESQQKEEREIIAYCVKCKQKRKMLKAHEVVMKNGRPAMRGVCSVCGTRLNRIGAPS